MARLARVVAPGLPHHVTQRGNRRQQTFFCDEDYESYLQLMAQFCKAEKVEVWAYCLMPNHVHLIAVPQSAEGLRRAIGEAHRRYTRMVNFREGWRGTSGRGDSPRSCSMRHTCLPQRVMWNSTPCVLAWSTPLGNTGGAAPRHICAERMMPWCRSVPCFDWLPTGGGS